MKKVGLMLVVRKVYQAIHRLDKLTSGLLVMGKGEKMVAKYQAEMKANNVHKKYIARVSGKPKEGTFTIDSPLFCSDQKHSRHSVAITPEDIAKAKPASTTFTVIWYDEQSDTSLLHCYPLTGRTHQIRVHLQSAGHSIVNDVNYGGQRVGNVRLHHVRDESIATLGKREPLSWNKTPGALIDDNGFPLHPLQDGQPQKIKKVEAEAGVQVGPGDGKEAKTETCDGAKKEEKNLKDGKEEITEAKPYEKNKKEKQENAYDDDEEEMRMFSNYGDDNDLTYTPFSEDRIMEIWLHSFEYTILGKTVQTSMPYWAEPSVLHDI
jgi:hypothetical protein